MTAHKMRPAALPWYNFAESRPTLERVWNDVAFELRDAGVAQVPIQLDHSTPHQDLLSHPNLLLSQCCGPDLFEPHAIAVQPIAVPIFSGYEVTPGHYYSYITTRRDVDQKRPRVAINSYSSHSGYTAATNWLAASGIREYTTLETGSHANSISALQSGAADVAAIDALSWQYLDTRSLVILDKSAPVLAPPFVTASEIEPPKELFVEALNTALNRHGEAIGISGAMSVTKSQYQSFNRTRLLR